MTFANLFDVKTLIQSFSLSKETNINISRWVRDPDLLLCEIVNKDVKNNYILVKKYGESHTNRTSDFILKPEIFVEDKSGQRYSAFREEELNGFVLMEKNNISHLNAVLENLAKYQAKHISTVDIKNFKYNVKGIIDSLLLKNEFSEIDSNKIKEIVDKLQQSADEVLDKTILVRSIIAPDSNKVFISKETTGKILLLEQGSEAVNPPVHEAILFVFFWTDEKFRQKHFKILLLNYYNEIRTNLQDDEESSKHFNRNNSENQVRVLLPIVKFQLANISDDTGLTTNIKNFFKCPMLNQEDIYEVVLNKLKSDDFDLIGYDLNELIEKNGHLGQYYHLTINTLFKGNSLELKLFAKFLIAPNETGQKLLKLGPVLKEDFFYNTLLPFYAENGLGNLLDFAPKCYLSRLYWVMVFDDLNEQGFETLKPNTVLDYRGLKSLIEQLAKYHSTTLIMEEILSRKQDKPTTMVDYFPDMFKPNLELFEMDVIKKLMRASEVALQYLVELSPEITDKINLPKDERLKLISETHLRAFQKLSPSDKFRNVISHGDMYIGNALFKLDPNRSVSKAILIDFQGIKYGIPAIEVLAFIYVTSTKETRAKYLNQLLDDYYETLSKHLNDFNLNPDEIYSKKTFDDSLNYIKDSSLIRALIYGHMMHLDPEFRQGMISDTEKFNYYMYEDRKALIDVGWSSEHYRNVMHGLVEDLFKIIVPK